MPLRVSGEVKQTASAQVKAKKQVLSIMNVKVQKVKITLLIDGVKVDVTIHKP